MKKHLILTWEDVVFGIITMAWFFTPGGAIQFHLYTIGVIILVLSLSFRRGLEVGLVRTAVLAGFLFQLHRFHGAPVQPTPLEVFALTVGSLVSGFMGEQHRRTQESLERSVKQIIDVLARSLECRDPYTEGHSRRTARYAVAMARDMDLDETDIAVLEQAGLLHDLGKIGVPDAILRKAGGLTPEEAQQIARHPEEGDRILRGIPALAKAAKLVRHHHEHFDGSGYPMGLRDGSIPFGDRILSVADAYDALTTDRPYRKAMSPAAAIQKLQSNVGKLFDPRVVQVLEKLWQEGKLHPLEVTIPA